MEPDFFSYVGRLYQLSNASSPQMNEKFGFITTELLQNRYREESEKNASTGCEHSSYLFTLTKDNMGITTPTCTTLFKLPVFYWML